jgi:hypothetical protein
METESSAGAPTGAVCADIAAAIDASDSARAVAAFDAAKSQGVETWDIHLGIFPVVQKVLNPPFINPHLPKMYGICRELVAYLDKDDVPSLVRLEVAEYARRPKLGELEAGNPRRGVSFADIERSLRDDDPAGTAQAMASFWREAGSRDFSRRLLLLGSGYLDKSLGHSISCTAFILLEGMQRGEQELWPMFVLLADYFHKGGFNTTTPLDDRPVSEEEMDHHLLRATSGGGIVELHDTITIYAIERIRSLFPDEEYRHLVRAWIGYLKEKSAREVRTRDVGRPETFEAFFDLFSSHDADAVAAAAARLIDTEEGRRRLARYLIRSVCALYQGNYNPHHITGLGSLHWLLERQPPENVMLNALHQYATYFFSEFGKSRA